MSLRSVYRWSIPLVMATAAIVAAASCDSDGVCSPGDTRDCACADCGSYVGCGECNTLLAFECVEKCDDDGRWSGCYGRELEPECEAFGQNFGGTMCSATLRALLYAKDLYAKDPALPEPECRSAFEVWAACVREACADGAWCDPPSCSADAEAMDLACFGIATPCM